METELKNIKDLSVADRPREKLIRHGAAVLSNTELIAIILRSGSQALPLAAICRSLILAIGDDMANLDQMTIEQITTIKGIGEIKAITLLAAIELGKRSQVQDRPLSLKDETAIENLMKNYFTNDSVAQYHLVLINNRDELLATSELKADQGELPDLKDIMKLSLEAGAAQIMLCRNAIKLPSRFCDREKAFIIQLDAAASMLKLKMRGLLIVENT